MTVFRASVLILSAASAAHVTPTGAEPSLRARVPRAP